MMEKIVRWFDEATASNVLLAERPDVVARRLASVAECPMTQSSSRLVCELQSPLGDLPAWRSSEDA